MYIYQYILEYYMYEQVYINFGNYTLRFNKYKNIIPILAMCELA